MTWLQDLPVAHRGLHDGNHEVAENSLPAFRAAISAGYAIEFDLCLSGDGVPMVFHDDDMERMTGKPGLFTDLTAEQLSASALIANGGPIPTLRQVLDEVDGAVPLLVEVKNPNGEIEGLCEATALALDNYAGDFAIQSFNPLILEWFRTHRPNFTRGCITTDYEKIEWGTPESRARVSKAVAGEVGDPQFYAQDVRFIPDQITERTRRKGLPLLVWTVKTEADLKKARDHGGNVIFEQVEP